MAQSVSKAGAIAAERQRQALDLRRAGATYEQIARTLGYRSFSGARKAVQSGLKTSLREPADELRQLMADRLDTALRAIWPQVVAGDYDAIATMLKIETRRAKLFGLDAPMTFSGELLLKKLAERAAIEDGLDPQAVLAEAEAILRELTPS